MDKRNKLKLEEDVEKLSKLLSYVQERNVQYTEKELSPV
jgi:ribosomal protein S15P/S13E